MEGVRGTVLRIALAIGVVVGLLGSSTSSRAQSEADDAAARAHFTRGREAYAQTRYEEALTHFREAYRLSQRGQLQYNIGLAADRLLRHDEAIAAFERYLAEVESPRREQEARVRILELRLSIAEREQREQTLAQAAAVRYEAAPAKDQAQRKVPKSAIVGGSILAAAGAAGVATMGVALSRGGECLERDQSSGVCITERARSPWAMVYGAVGIAALAGSATWFVVSSKRSKRKTRDTALRLAPTGVVVSGSF